MKSSSLVAILVVLSMSVSAFSASAADNSGRRVWTDDDVKAFCNGRWANRPSKLQTCLKNHEAKLGQRENDFELGELRKINSMNQEKAKAAANNPSK